jgi:hypothetical protein
MTLDQSKILASDRAEVFADTHKHKFVRSVTYKLVPRL